jgi:hypothetical protein
MALMGCGGGKVPGPSGPFQAVLRCLQRGTIAEAVADLPPSGLLTQPDVGIPAALSDLAFVVAGSGNMGALLVAVPPS